MERHGVVELPLTAERSHPELETIAVSSSSRACCRRKVYKGGLPVSHLGAPTVSIGMVRSSVMIPGDRTQLRVKKRLFISKTQNTG